MKGSASTHTYSDRGRERHDQIVWNSATNGRCRYQRIKKGKTSCLFDNNKRCDTCTFPYDGGVIKTKYVPYQTT